MIVATKYTKSLKSSMCSSDTQFFKYEWKKMKNRWYKLSTTGTEVLIIKLLNLRLLDCWTFGCTEKKTPQNVAWLYFERQEYF